jgi:hypothetical protein
VQYGELVYQLRLSCMYHKKRAAFFDHWVRWPQLIALLSSSAAVVQLWRQVGTQVFELSLLAAIGSAIGVVFSPSSRLHLHNELSREFGKILSSAELVGPRATREQINGWMSQRTSAEMREPPQMTALVEHCQYEISLSDVGHERMPRPGFIRSVLKQWVDFGPMNEKEPHSG